MDPSTYEALRNQTLLFFIEKLLEKSPRSLHDLSCQFGSRNFTKEMRQIAGGSQAGLKKFLLQYPSIFTLDAELVSYTTGVKQKVNRDYNKEAVEYFRNRLLQYGFNVRVPIKSLLGHRSQANTEIRHVSGQHISEFRDFLERNHEFVVSEEFVSLKEFEHEKITEFREVNMNYDKESVYKLCKFFVTLIEDKGPMLVEQLFHQVGVQFDAGAFEGIFKNPNDLGVFLKIQPQCFQVHSNLVTLSETYSMGLDMLHRQCDNGPKFKVQPEMSNTSTHVSVLSNVQRSPSFTTSPPNNTNDRNSSAQQQGPVPLLSLSLNNHNLGPRTNQVVNTLPPTPSSNNNSSNSKGNKSTLKQRVNSILIQTLTENTDKDYKNSAHQNQGHGNGRRGGGGGGGTEEERYRHQILSNLSIITNKRKAKETVDYLLKQDFLGVDCEGVNLGIDGKVTLVQVAISEGPVFIFDLLSDLSGEIRRLMESDILKVIHDCRNDSVNLYNQFGIELKNIFDTQAAHVVIQSEAGQKAKNISLNNLCEIYGLETNQFKDKVKSVYRYDQRYWLRRPLTPQMQCYAASDVIALIKLYPVLNAKLRNSHLLKELTFEQIQAHINPDEVKAKRRLRKNEGDVQELQAKLEGCPDLSRLVLSNRELRLIKHMALPDSMLDQLSNSVKIAKKLHKSALSDNSSSESNLTSLEMNGLDSGCFNTPPETMSTTTSTTEKIDSIERLIDRIFTPAGETGAGVRVDSGTQTVSTGDIVLSKIWDED